MYLRNTWYVAAWDSEIDRTPRQIKVLGEKIVVFRTEAGDPVALIDACPHRKLPYPEDGSRVIISNADIMD